MCMRTQYEGVFFVARLEAGQLIVQHGVESGLVYMSIFVHNALGMQLLWLQNVALHPL